MSLFVECGKREQDLRIKKEELINKYSFAVDSRVLETLFRAYGFLAKVLQHEWSDRRNLSIIMELHEKYNFLNELFESEAKNPKVEESIEKIEETVFKKTKKKSTSSHGNIPDILEYKSGAQITKMLNNTDKSLTKLKPYMGLSKVDTIKLLETIRPVCTKEKQKLIDDFLGGL